MLFLARTDLALPRSASCHLFEARVNNNSYFFRDGKERSPTTSPFSLLLLETLNAEVERGMCCKECEQAAFRAGRNLQGL